MQVMLCAVVVAVVMSVISIVLLLIFEAWQGALLGIFIWGIIIGWLSILIAIAIVVGEDASDSH